MAGLLSTVAMAEEERHFDRENPQREGKDRPHFVRPEDMFKRMDRDGDGKISKREFFASPRMERLPEEKREAFFARLDRDGNDFLTGEEIRAMRQDAERRMREDFRKLDSDNSGGLSYEEYSKGEFASKLPEEKRRQIFTRMDTDGSGEINAADKPNGPPIRPEKPENRNERRVQD